MKTIGLSMIVKNEAPVILRCLESVRPLLDYVLIVDTGSSDGTPEIIRNYLRQHRLPGEVLHEPWQDFASNRSSALARLRQRTEIDYALIMDADDVLTLPAGFDPLRFKASLSADLYNVWFRLGPIQYHRPQICSNRLAFRYRGVLHEFLEGPGQLQSADAPGLLIIPSRDGARSRNEHKYTHDAALLEQALKTEQDPLLLSRYTFYLAQSYRDAGEPQKALPLYLRRAAQDFWAEERFVSLNEAAKIKALLNHPASEVIGLFLEAYEVCPTRAESLHGAMQYCRNQSKFHQGYLVGKQAVTIPRPEGGLFLEDWVYRYGLFDEFAVLAYWSGHYDECRDYATRILREAHIPVDQRERIAANVRFAQERQQETPIHLRSAQLSI